MADPVDNAQRESDELIEFGMAAHIRRQLAESALPINWLGICHACDEHIAPKRLEANPRVLRCIGCQTEKELSEARR